MTCTVSSGTLNLTQLNSVSVHRHVTINMERCSSCTARRRAARHSASTRCAALHICVYRYSAAQRRWKQALKVGLLLDLLLHVHMGLYEQKQCMKYVPQHDVPSQKLWGLLSMINPAPILIAIVNTSAVIIASRWFRDHSFRFVTS